MPERDALLGKLDAQVGALNKVAVTMNRSLREIDDRTLATHRLLVASSILGPAHRFNFTLALLSFALAFGALVAACRNG